MKIGIFGGTFDPIHRGHIEAARAAADEFRLDRVLFVPAGFPPHKDNASADYEQRFRMVELASGADPRFEVSRLEAPEPDQQRRHYSVDTMEKLNRQLGAGNRLFFLIGRDAFAEIATWYRIDDVVRQIEFIVMNRPGGELDELEIPAGARVHLLRGPMIDVSSTDIRDGHPLADSLSPAVSSYIKEHDLYRK